MDNGVRNPVTRLENLVTGKFYKIYDLQAILKDLGLSYSIFTIRDYETWKCLNYQCGHRNNKKVDVCEKCGGAVRAPLIISPRTKGGGKGSGHRRYTVDEIKEIVRVFEKRI